MPIFRARTELVRLDVSMTDGDGRPVDDVRADEIDIREGGKRIPVVLFRHLNDSRSGEQRRSDFNEVSDNSLAPAGHLYVIVFDQLHIRLGEEQRARLAADKFIAQQLKPGDAVALYGLPGPGPVTGFTSDFRTARSRLIEVRGQAGRPTGTMTEFEAYRLSRGDNMNTISDAGRSPLAANMPVGASMPGAARSLAIEGSRDQASQIVSQADTQSNIFLSQLADVMRSMRLIEGRKTVILFSQGFFIDNLSGKMEQVASAAAQSNSVVYAFDLNRLQIGGLFPGGGMSSEEVAARRDPLATLAAETNGRVITGVGDLDSQLAAIAAETNDYYLIGFEPSSGSAPHDYHRVKVNVKRRGVMVHARTGYSTAPLPVTNRQAIDVALGVPRTAVELPLEYTTYERIGSTPGKARIIVSLDAHLPKGAPTGEGAEMIFVVRDAQTGQAVASGTDQIHATSSSSQSLSDLDDVPYSVQFDLSPGDYFMRVLVRDPGGVMGTADRRFHVWPISDQALATSDLIVARLDGARFNAPALADVTRGDDVLAYMEIYGNGDTLKDADAKVEVIRADSNKVVATAEPVVKTGSHGERIVRAKLPVGSLPEGDYSARVRVLAPNQSPRVVMRSFKVIGDHKGNM